MTLLFLLTFLFRGSAFAESSVIQASLVDFAPLSWSENKKIKGTYVDFLKLVEKRSGLKISIQAFPFLRAVERVQTGVADFTIIPSLGENAQAYGNKIILYKSRYVLLSRKKKPFCSLEEVTGEIGRLRGGCQGLLNDKKVHYFDVSSSYDQGLTMLQRGRLDGFCGVEVGMAFSLKTLGLDTRNFRKIEIMEKDQNIYFSPKFSKSHFEKSESTKTKAPL